ASPSSSRTPTHDSGSPWAANPSMQSSLISFSMPVYPGAPKLHSIERRSKVWRDILSGRELPDSSAYVLEDGDETIGFAHISPSRDADAPASTGELTAIYLAPEYWGRGGGSLLMDVAMTNLRAAGFHRATLWVLASNVAARRFYESTGWAADGALKTDDRGTFELVELRYSLAIY
ncbi:MAG: GNAT family N-acetyltransferase, partial [Acidimicrobiales bacterium]